MSLGLDEDKASELHHRYYTEYGLALRGLVRHHEIGEYKNSPRHPVTPVARVRHGAEF